MISGEVTRPYTPEMLSKRWGCSAHAVRGLIKRGDLLAFRLGRWMRVPADAVEAFERLHKHVRGA